MKIKISILFFALFNVMNTCNSDHIKRDALIREMLKAEELQSLKTDGTLYILNNEFCKEQACDEIFENFKNQIAIISKEDAFMQGIRTLVEIESIDQRNKYITLLYYESGLKKELQIDI